MLANAANEMSIGEMRQLTSYDALDFGEDDYFRLIAAKTASLMSAACEMGAISGAPEHRRALASYGHNLGMAFQIADDLLDYTGTEAVTGKPTGQDLRERKVTLPLVSALTRVSDAERQEVRKRSSRALIRPMRKSPGSSTSWLSVTVWSTRARWRAIMPIRLGNALESLPGGAGRDVALRRGELRRRPSPMMRSLMPKRRGREQR